MSEREISGTPQSNSPTSKVPGAAPGGPFRLDMTRPISTPVSPHYYTLQLLITLIKKKSDQPNSSPPNE